MNALNEIMSLERTNANEGYDSICVVLKAISLLIKDESDTERTRLFTQIVREVTDSNFRFLVMFDKFHDLLVDKGE